MTARRALTKAERQRLLDAYGCCAGCGRHVASYEKWEADHIKPLVEGGADELENMQPLCPQCHAAKSGGENRARGKTRRIQRTNDEYAQYGRKLNARERQLVKMGKDVD